MERERRWQPWSGRGTTEEPFALVLTDGMMPEMDGFELAEQIRQHSELAGATIMMLSSAGHPSDRARCRELGVSAYLTKPIKQSDLLNTIVNVLHPSSVEVPESSPHTHPAPPASHRRLHLLLTEDNTINQRVALGMLKQRGHTVVVASNGKEALAALEREAFDVVLMDVQMPEMDGFESYQSYPRERRTNKRWQRETSESSDRQSTRLRTLGSSMTPSLSSHPHHRHDRSCDER